MIQLNLKIILSSYLCYLRFMLILGVTWKDVGVVVEIIILNKFRNIKHIFLWILLTACIQFMNSRLYVLVNNLSHNDFKYLLQEFRGDLLELVKPKECIHMNIWTVLKSFLKLNYPTGVNYLILKKMSVLVKKTIHWLLMFETRKVY